MNTMEKKTNLDKLNENRQKQLDDMLKNGKLGVMTECAYGNAIADTETKKPIKLDKDKT